MRGKSAMPSWRICISTVFILAGLLEPAHAQDILAMVANAKKAHNDCFFTSVAAQMSAVPKGQILDHNMMPEQAFVACATEERLLATALSLSTLPPDQIQIGLLGNRTGLKRELNKTAANPRLYLR